MATYAKDTPLDPIVDAVPASLKAAGLEGVFSTGIEPNPRAQTIDKALEQFIEEPCDIVIALGGGKSGDYVVLGSRVPRDYTGSFTIIFIPTVSAAASETNAGGVIQNAATNEKNFSRSPKFLTFHPRPAHFQSQFVQHVAVFVDDLHHMAAGPGQPGGDGAFGEDFAVHDLAQFIVFGHEARPLSLVVNGANRHDVSQLGAALDAIMVERLSPPIRRHKHLCADAGYTEIPALKVIEENGYILHVKGREQEAMELKRTPRRKQDAGLSKWHTVGLAGVANYWCDTRSLIAASWL